MSYNNNPSVPDDMAWDLRTFYVQWVSRYMVDFYQAQTRNNYPEMLTKISSWHSSVWGRSIDKFDKKKKDETFTDLINDLINLSNKYRDVYLGRKREAQAVALIDEAFSNLVVYVLHLMKKNKMFGVESKNLGLT